MNNLLYQNKVPCTELSELVNSFWVHHNPLNKTQIVTISASSYVKFVFFVKNNQISYYVLTGLWTLPKEIHVPPNTTLYGCRMNILAPEFLLQREVASLCNKMVTLDSSYLNVGNFSLDSFDEVISQWETELLKIKSIKAIPSHKLNLSKLLYTKNGDISPTEVYEQIFWANRQINRYLNKQIGIPLKKYLNIQKCNDAFTDIVEGNFYPSKNYYDRPHFIREVKKYTGDTPQKIFEQKNDRFIQLKNISKH